MPQLGSRKSRKGCKRCKQRRVKCDEQIPCGYCSKRKEICSFLTIPTPIRTPDVTEDSALPVDSDDWVLDLELMYHYITILHRLGAREKVIHLWRDYIPQQAIKHPFLMHGLLAFAALHLAHLRPQDSSKYLELCDKHQGVALQKFRSILSSPVDLECADALVALSATLSLSSMARSCALSDSVAMDMDSIAELFVLTKGIANVIQLSKQHIRQGPLAEMFELQQYPEGATVHLPPSVASRLKAVREMLVSYGLDPQALKHCQFALTQLEEVYKNIAYFAPAANIEMGTVSKWQVGVPMDFVRLIQACNPPATIILAYYAAAITAIRTAWYTKNWAECALRGINQALDDDLRKWIQWPMRQIYERMSELGVQAPSDQKGLQNPLAVIF